VYVKVVEVTPEERGPRIAASIKLVSQRDGEDLDPHFLKFRPRGEGGGGGQQHQAMGAAAKVQDAVVDWGHLKADVVQYGDKDRQYEILGSDEEAEVQEGHRGGRGGGGGGGGRPPMQQVGRRMTMPSCLHSAHRLRVRVEHGRWPRRVGFIARSMWCTRRWRPSFPSFHPSDHQCCSCVCTGHPSLALSNLPGRRRPWAEGGAVCCLHG
jgi:hypothetical protein